MDKKTEALKLALESLVDNRHYIVANERTEYLEIYDKSIDAVEKALAEQASKDKEQAKTDAFIKQVDQALAEQPAPQQEPVAWMFTDKEGTEFFEQHEDWEGRWTPLYTSPPASKPWLGLTFKEKKEIERLSVYVEGAIRHTEAKLKAKNNG